MKLPQRPSSGSGLEWRYASERHTTRREQLPLDGQAAWIGTASHWLWTLTRNKLEVLSAFWNGSRFIVIDIRDDPRCEKYGFKGHRLCLNQSSWGRAASEQQLRAL